MINKKEKRHYKSKAKSDIINFPLDLRRDLLSAELNKEVLNMPISAIRIIFKILNDVSYDQYQKSNEGQKKQFSLFEDDFKTEHNTYARFTFKVSDVSNNNDYTNTKKGLEFLEGLNKGWYTSTNKNGKKIKSYGGVISDANISEGNISFLISSYWMEKLMDIHRYNQAFLKTAWALSKTKQVLFYLWLLEIPKTGTKRSFDNIQSVFEYNYKKPYDYVKNVLKPIKLKLDKYSNKSFNCSVKGNIIHIVPYLTKDVALKLDNKTKDKQKVNQRLHYWSVRHDLEKNDIDILKSLINIDYSNFNLFNKSYETFKIECRKEKIKTTAYKGKDFMSIFQEKIKKVHENSAWGNIPNMRNSYPKILEKVV